MLSSSLLSSDEKQLVRNSAFQILDSSIDPDKLFAEACLLAEKFKDKGTNQCVNKDIVKDFVSSTCVSGIHTKNKLNLSSSSLALQIVGLDLKCKQETNQSSLLTDNLLEKFYFCMSLLKRSIEEKVFIQSLFSSIVLKHKLPLEILWNLHSHDVLSLELYLNRRISDKLFQSSLSKEVVSLCETETSRDEIRRRRIFNGFMAYVISQTYGETTQTSAYKKEYMSVLDSIITGILRINKQTLVYESRAMLPWISVDVVNRFNVHALSLIMHVNSEQKAFECDKAWNTVDAESMFYQLLKQFFITLSLPECLDVLQRITQQNLINATSLRNFMVALCDNFTDIKQPLLEFVSKLLTIGIGMSNKNTLATAFLVVRTTSLVRENNFLSYQDWFQQQFGEESSSPVSSKSDFVFFMNFLTSLVPTEKAENLKAHIFRKPYIPAKCKDIYDEYLILAKTRLSDLQEPLVDETKSIFKDEGEKLSIKTDPGSEDVDRAVEYFASSGKMPTAVIEASIFRKPYFLGKFLPALLKPRVLPDSPDPKMCLIEEIKKSGKIPNSLYNTYTEGCIKEKQALFEGVFDVDDDEEDLMEEMLQPPLDQLQNQLEKYTQAFRHESDINKFDELIVNITSRLELCGVKKDECDQLNKPLDMEINLKINDEASLYSQVVDKILDCCASIGSAEQHGLDTLEEMTSVQELLFKVLQYDHLKHLIYSKLLRKMITKESSGSSAADHALTVAALTRLPSCNIHLTTRISESSKLLNNILDACLACLESLRDGLVQFLRFGCRYVILNIRSILREEEKIKDADIVELLDSCKDLDYFVPSRLIKQIIFLTGRCGYDQCNASPTIFSFAEVNELLSLPKWLELAEKHQISFTEWLEKEIQMTHFGEFMPENMRSEYLLRTTLGYLKNKNRKKETANYSVHEICRILFKSLCLDFEARKEWRSDIVKLLKTIIDQLLSSEELWLLDILKNHPENGISCKLALSLQPYLILCNQHQTVLSESNVSKCLHILGYFTRSDQNEGCYLSLNTTIHCIRGITRVLEQQEKTIDLGLLDPIFQHPVIVNSLLMHKTNLENLQILSTSGIKQLCKNVFDADIWVQRIIETSTFTASKENPKIQASAIFSKMFSSERHKCINVKTFVNNIDRKCLLWLAEYLLIWLSINYFQHRNLDLALRCDILTVISKDVFVCKQILTLHNREVVELLEFSGSESTQVIHTIVLLRLLCSPEIKSKVSCLLPEIIQSYCQLRKRVLEFTINSETDSIDALVDVSSMISSLVQDAEIKYITVIDTNELDELDPVLVAELNLKKRVLN